MKLDNDVLDNIISDIAEKSLDIVERYATSNLTPTDKVEYLARAFTEILGVVVVSCPSDKIAEVYQNTCNFLKGSIQRNEKMIEIEKQFGLPPEAKDLKVKFQDTLFTAKKADA